MKHIRDFKQLLNEKSENLIYTLKTNEYDSKIIAKDTDLDVMLSNLENKILDKRGNGKIDFKFVKDYKNIEKNHVLNGSYILIVNYNGKFYNNFIIDVSNSEKNFTDSSLY